MAFVANNSVATRLSFDGQAGTLRQILILLLQLDGNVRNQAERIEQITTGDLRTINASVEGTIPPRLSLSPSS